MCTGGLEKWAGGLAKWADGMDMCVSSICMLRGGMQLTTGGLDMRIGGQGTWAEASRVGRWAGSSTDSRTQCEHFPLECGRQLEESLQFNVQFSEKYVSTSTIRVFLYI